MKKIPYTELASLNGEDFIDNCYARLLHREADPTGRDYFLSRLEAGEDKALIIGGILRSEEGRRVGEQVGGLWGRYLLRRLQKLPVIGACIPARSAEVDRALRAIDNQLYCLVETGASATEKGPAVPRSQQVVAVTPSARSQPAPPPAAVAMARPSRPSMFLVLDAMDGLAPERARVLGRLGRAFIAQGESTFFVRWNADNRNFQLVTRKELDAIELMPALGELAAIYPVDSETRTIIGPSSCGKDDWLLVPHAVRAATDKPYLAEKDVILESRRLGLRSAFIFHGADPLRLRKHAGSEAEAHEQYMQALLLADAIAPVSALAESDLKAFFVRHQRADSAPLIRTIPLPAEARGDRGNELPAYAGRIRDLLAEAADRARQLASLYYWIDSTAAAGAPANAFAPRLASALTGCGIALIPVVWDVEHKRLVSPEGGSPDHWKEACAPGSWAEWIEPGRVDSPRWVFHPGGVRGELLAEVAAFARTRGLRTAAILPEAADRSGEGDSPAPDASDRVLFEALAGIDKVLVVSERRTRELYRFLLSWRGKVHSAEHRIRTIATPRRPVRSWDSYAREIIDDLATDRLTDSLRPVEPQPVTDVYAALVNLRKRPRLSLCISTYNRAGWVAVNLRNIFSQIPTPNENLEVLVVDNTSTDNTPEVVKPYLTRSDFRFVRNPKNVGMLGNLAVTAQRARGDYIWIVGDDDLTRPGAIVRVLQIIDQHPGIALIYLNYGYSTEVDPGNVTDLASFLANYNQLEPAGPDEYSTVKRLAAKNENFFGAIYSHVYRRDHAMRSYCQDTSGRIFSTMLSCIPTTYYVLNYMADEPAYWIGEPSLVINSNVSWQDYGTLLELEQLPRAWDLAERMGADPGEVDRRRGSRLWLVEMMWKEMFENDKAGNSAYFSASRVLMRLKHLKEIDERIPELKSIYERARQAGHPAALMPVEELFSAFDGGRGKTDMARGEAKA